MKNILVILFLFLFKFEIIFAQNQINNIGFAVFEVKQNIIYEFLNSPKETKPSKTISFIIKSNDIIFSEGDPYNGPEWLKNDGKKIDYYLFHFKVTNLKNDYVEVIVNEETNDKLWIKVSENVKYYKWENYLLEFTTGIDRIDKTKSFIFTEPSEKSETITYNVSHDCLKIVEVKGDWIKVENDVYCDDKEKISNSGWIRWKNNSELLIYYFLLC